MSFPVQLFSVVILSLLFLSFCPKASERAKPIPGQLTVIKSLGGWGLRFRPLNTPVVERDVSDEEREGEQVGERRRGEVRLVWLPVHNNGIRTESIHDIIWAKSIRARGRSPNRCVISMATSCGFKCLTGTRLRIRHLRVTDPSYVVIFKRSQESSYLLTSTLPTIWGDQNAHRTF